mmetsp:Transcript_12179/g.49027  ORF Transcript_12179/g.49027 Transcript_12179/m.49027 type:complete len:231 (+) Transcript_12179:55-747(+)
MASHRRVVDALRRRCSRAAPRAGGFYDCRRTEAISRASSSSRHRSSASAVDAKTKTYRVTARGARCAATTTTPRGHAVTTDTPTRDGGDDSGPEPVETLLAALVGCEQATAHFVARMLRVRIDAIEFDVRAERDARGATHRPLTDAAPVSAAPSRIWGTARVRVGAGIADAPGGQRRAAPRAATADDVETIGRIVHQRCPVASMVQRSGCRLEIAWVLASEDDAGNHASE